MAHQMISPLGDCHSIKFTAEADGVKDTFVASNDVLGVLFNDVEDGDDGLLLVKIPRMQVDKNAIDVEAGERVYRDPVADTFTNVETGRCRGFCNEGEAASAATMEIYFDGNLGSFGS